MVGTRNVGKCIVLQFPIQYVVFLMKLCFLRKIPGTLGQNNYLHLGLRKLQVKLRPVWEDNEDEKRAKLQFLQLK